MIFPSCIFRLRPIILTSSRSTKTWCLCGLTLNLLTTTIFAPPSNASKWQMGINSTFKGLKWYTFRNKFCENRGNLGKTENADPKQIPSYLESKISLPKYGDWIQSPIYYPVKST